MNRLLVRGAVGAALGFILLGLVFALNTQPTVAALPCSLCNVTVRTVTVGCNSDGSVQWNATVTNNANCAVADDWTAQLQIHQPSMPPGQYRTVASQTGSSAFVPGSTTVGGAFCYTAGAGVNSIRVAFAPKGQAGVSCKPQGKSASIAPCPACAIPTATPTTTPTATPSPSPSASPTATTTCVRATPVVVVTPAFTPGPGCSSVPASGVVTGAITLQPTTAGVLLHNNSTTCSYRVGLATYSKVDENIEHQTLYDYALAVIPPNSSLTLTVNVPSCAYEADAFYGDLIVSFAGGVRYNERLLDSADGNGTNYCPTICAP
jgi:hypothetical protein